MKTLTLAITFELMDIGLSYFACVFFVSISFEPYKHVLPCVVYLDIRTAFQDNISYSVYHLAIACDYIFPYISAYLIVTLTSIGGIGISKTNIFCFYQINKFWCYDLPEAKDAIEE